MELKPGFKQTDIGVIPENWTATTIGKFVQFSGGSQPPRDTFAFRQKPGYIRLIQIRDYKSDEFVTYIPEPLARKKCNDKDVMIGRYGPPIFQILRGIEGAYNVALIKTIPSKEVDVNFWYYFLCQDSLFQFIELLSRRSSGQTGVELPALKAYGFALPPLPEQRAIATALSDVDALLTKLDQLLAKKRDIKQGAMQELLTGKRRLPGFVGEWQTVPLEDVADPNQRWSFTGGPFGSNLKSSDYTDDGIRIIQLQNIGDGEFKDGYEIYTSERKADELLSCNIYPGEIILSKMGDPVARACIIPSRHSRYLMCSDGIRLAVDPLRFDTYFTYTQINAPDFRDRAANAGTGSTRKRIGLSELRRLELTFPKLPEQQEIASVLSEMDTEIAAIEARREKMKAIKQGMMQELLTGRIRLV